MYDTQNIHTHACVFVSVLSRVYVFVLLCVFVCAHVRLYALVFVDVYKLAWRVGLKQHIIVVGV